ncbi:platelet binding protein GspB isoform X4 [Hetaerina americana]|uniref:platelet binding protein GspB isoform X4 n=1 Tax=Hetaerina americana TaxID=62018 RepID=UPI003A7F3D43
MSYTELEHGYQGLKKARPSFYVGDDGDGGPSLRTTKTRGDLTDGGEDDDSGTGGMMGGMGVDQGEDSGGDEGVGGGCGSDVSKQVVVGVCAMAKKSQSKPMNEILTRLQEFEYLKIVVFPEEVILKEPVEDWPICDCLISFHSKGFPLDKAIQYSNLRHPFIINNLHMQYDIQDRRKVYSILEKEGIEIPRYAVLDRDSPDPKHHELVESEDHVEVNGVVFNKPFVEKPVSAEDHNIYIYYPTSAGGGSQRLFRKIGSRSSVYSPESRVRKTGSFIYEDFMPTDGTDVKVYTVGPDYAHAEARKSPALDGKVERDSEGKEIRYPVILSNAEKLISRKVCLAFKQTVCGFDLLRANGKSFVCDVNGFSFVKNSNKYYDDCAKILGNMILRELAPTLHIPWSVPFQLDDPPIVPTTFGKMMELRCVVAVIRHGDRTPKQKMKVEVRHPKFFEIFEKYDGYKDGHVKLKRPKQLQEILDIARSLLNEIQHRAADPEIEEKKGKLEQLKSVLEMYGHFSGINRKVQMKYQPRGRPRGSSSDDGKDVPKEPSLVLILKWGGELTPAGRVQAEELGRIFRCMYPGGQGREISGLLTGEYAGTQGLGLLRLHSTFRHDLKIYASDEGRVQMTAAAFAKGLLALEGELTPILVQMVKSANTNGLLDNDCDSSKYQNMAKARLHELMQQDREFTADDRAKINPCGALSISAALDFVKNPVQCCKRVHSLIRCLVDIVHTKRDDPKTKDAILYHGETWELMGRRWGKIEKDFCTKNANTYDISKIPDIYDCIKYDLQHNQHTLQFDQAEELYVNAKYLADIVIPQEYGLTKLEKLTIGQGICTPLLKKIRADLQRNIEESGEETVNRLNPRYSHGVSSPGRHVRTRLYFTSESHVHSLLTVLRYGGLINELKDEQWHRAMEYVSMVSELNYMSQIVVMLYEDPTKDPSSEERFHVELHFSPGVNCCVQKNLPPGPGFRPHSRNDSVGSKNMAFWSEYLCKQKLSSMEFADEEEEDEEASTVKTEMKEKEVETAENKKAEDEEEDLTLEEELQVSEPAVEEENPEEVAEEVDNAQFSNDLRAASEPIPIRSSLSLRDYDSEIKAARASCDPIDNVDGDAPRLSYHLGRPSQGSLPRSVNPLSPDSEMRSRSFEHARESTSSHSKDSESPLQTQSTPFTFPSVGTSPTESSPMTSYLCCPPLSYSKPNSVSPPEHQCPSYLYGNCCCGCYHKCCCSCFCLTTSSLASSPPSKCTDGLVPPPVFPDAPSPGSISSANASLPVAHRVPPLSYNSMSCDSAVKGRLVESTNGGHSCQEENLSAGIQYLSQIPNEHLQESKAPSICSNNSKLLKNINSVDSEQLSCSKGPPPFHSDDDRKSNSSCGKPKNFLSLFQPILNFSFSNSPSNESPNSNVKPSDCTLNQSFSSDVNCEMQVVNLPTRPSSISGKHKPDILDSGNVSSQSGSRASINSGSSTCHSVLKTNLVPFTVLHSSPLSSSTLFPPKSLSSNEDFLSGFHTGEESQIPQSALNLGCSREGEGDVSITQTSKCPQSSEDLDLSSEMAIPRLGSLPLSEDKYLDVGSEDLSDSVSSPVVSSSNDVTNPKTKPVTSMKMPPAHGLSSTVMSNLSSFVNPCYSPARRLSSHIPISDCRLHPICCRCQVLFLFDPLNRSYYGGHQLAHKHWLTLNLPPLHYHSSPASPASPDDASDGEESPFKVSGKEGEVGRKGEVALDPGSVPPSCPDNSSPDAPIVPPMGAGPTSSSRQLPSSSSTATPGEASHSKHHHHHHHHHRHSVSGQLSYFRLLPLGGVGGAFQFLHHHFRGTAFGAPGAGGAGRLFSTAVISGSSSAPNLSDMIPNVGGSVSAIEGCGGVPPIRPLETLHNALSLRQLDAFLQAMTMAPLCRTTPLSSPPHDPPPPGPPGTHGTPSTQGTSTSMSSSQTSSTASSGGHHSKESREILPGGHPPPLRLQSPSNSIGWSGPPSFVSSSSGPSSPNGCSSSSSLDLYLFSASARSSATSSSTHGRRPSPEYIPQQPLVETQPLTQQAGSGLASSSGLGSSSTGNSERVMYPRSLSTTPTLETSISSLIISGSNFSAYTPSAYHSSTTTPSTPSYVAGCVSSSKPVYQQGAASPSQTTTTYSSSHTSCHSSIKHSSADTGTAPAAGVATRAPFSSRFSMEIDGQDLGSAGILLDAGGDSELISPEGSSTPPSGPAELLLEDEDFGEAEEAEDLDITVVEEVSEAILSQEDVLSGISPSNNNGKEESTQ